jgi:hypothetical protein
MSKLINIYMKKVILILLFALTLFISGCQTHNPVKDTTNNEIYTLDKTDNLKETFFDEEKVEKLFLNYPANRFKYDSETKKIYGISYINGLNQFISVNIETGNIDYINKFPEIAGLQMGLDAIDTKNKRYFFVGSINNSNFLYVLELNTGKVLFKHKLKEQFVIFEYNNKTDELYGLSRIEGINSFVKYDLYKNKITIIKQIPNLSGISMNMHQIDYSKNTFLFVGNMNNQNSLLEIDISNGNIEIIDAYQVGVDDYKVFKLTQKTNTIFTIGVQTCTAIVGYNQNSKVGFLAHFSPENNNIEETFSKIDKEIRKKGVDGFMDMDLYIVGGVKEIDNSYINTIKIYREMNEKYKNNYQGDKIYHLGKPYNIIISGGNINIY